MKMFEEFIQADYELDQIINKIMERIKYWFQEGSFSMTSTLVDQGKSSTPNAGKRSIIANFADVDFYYQMIIRFTVEDLEHCDVIIKKYNPTTMGDYKGGMPVWTIELTNDNNVKINDVKEDFIIKEISEKEDKTKDNPDENKIEAPKEKEEEKPQPQMPQGGEQPGQMPGQIPPPGEQMPPAQAPSFSEEEMGPMGL